MAAITISTDTFLDGGNARVAGDTYTINGATFTIRTDTRVHSTAPAAMTGALGSMTVSSTLGGTIAIDGTKVRWLAFTGGSGNVPFIGTSITQVGVSGYFLGVWADLQSAPTAVGAAMPATGYIKFREVNGGTFKSGALSGIGASAASADVAGWIEVCLDSGASIATQEFGNGLTVRGDWFYLDTTTGTRGQQIKTPTNGGGTGTHVFGVQIETAAGSGVYEWYPTATTVVSAVGAQNWGTANFTTDQRAKYVESMGNGVIRIGSDGTNNIGYLPPSGCKVRIPNVFGRTVATTSRATNQVPGVVTRGAVSGGNYDFDGLHSDFSVAGTGAAVVRLQRFTCEPTLVFNQNRDPVLVDNCCFGGFTSSAAAILSFANASNGTITNTKICNIGAINGAFSLSNASNFTVSNVQVDIVKSRTTTVRTFNVSAAKNLTVTNLKLGGGGISITSLNGGSFTNTDYIDRLEGPTTATAGVSAITFAASTNVVFDGLTFGNNGSLSNTHCMGTLFASATSTNANISIRNAGTRNSPLDCGSSATVYPTSAVALITGDSNIKVQRIFLTGLRQGFVTGSLQGNVGLFFEDLYVSSGVVLTNYYGTNAVYRKLFMPVSTTPTASVIGSHWVDGYASDTVGYVRWSATSPSPESAPLQYVVTSPSVGTGFNCLGATVSLDTAGDYLVSESPHVFLGHTGFSGAPVLTGTATANTTVYYDLDTGSGFSGEWKQATAANLMAESISPAGFKMRMKMLRTTSTEGSIQFIRFPTTTTAADQSANQYPLDTTTLSFEGLIPGSEVRAYVGSLNDPANAVEIGGIEATSGSTWSFTHTAAGQQGYIMVFAMGYQPVIIPRTYQATDSTLLIQPVVDRNYVNP